MKSLRCFSHHLTSTLATVRSWYPKKPESPILGCVNNVSNTPDLALTQEMDMDISSPDPHQLTISQPHTKAVNSLIKTTPKGKGKKKKKKVHISTSFSATSPPLHDTVKKVKESSAPLLDSHAGKEKCLKVQDAEAVQVITGYQTSKGCQFVQDILIYDVSAK
ncbi:hypothetical protein RclHR1_25720003 [Rhizophagus clarus]|uniref:Uncharacterized protein n=1 Tax=Rhizophagus clarus TaxID=94130 RepID=A0A2Z6R036_9GLOM|nr:hypothetical protein RclHR1_25720003 [Rhizophagus clarus]